MNEVDKIFEDIVSESDIDQESTTTEPIETEAAAAVTVAAIGGLKALGTAGAVSATKIVENKQYPISAEIKKDIVNRVKLQMKFEKFAKIGNPSMKFQLELKKEIVKLDMKISKYKLTLKDRDKQKDVDEYIKKCEVKFGPKSIYYATLRVPKEISESFTEEDLYGDVYLEMSADDELICESIDDLIKRLGVQLSKGTIDKATYDKQVKALENRKANEAENIANQKKKEEQEKKDKKRIFTKTTKSPYDRNRYERNEYDDKPSFYNSFAGESVIECGECPECPCIAPKYREIILPYMHGHNNIDDVLNGLDYQYVTDSISQECYNAVQEAVAKFGKERIAEEFSIGAMLPMCGSTQGVGDLNEIDKSLGITNNISEKDDVDMSDVPDSLKSESVREYIAEPDAMYNVFVENAITDTVNNFASNVKVSHQLKKLAAEKAVLKAKLKIATKRHATMPKLIELKKELIQKNKELRSLKHGLSKETLAEMEEMERNIDGLTEKQTAKIEKELIHDGFITEEKDVKESVDEQRITKDSLDSDWDATNISSGIDTLVSDVINVATNNDNETINSDDYMNRKAELEGKIREAENRNDTDAIRSYSNQLKGIELMHVKKDQQQSLTGLPLDNINSVIPSVEIEAANIDDDMVGIIKTLNEKGYATKYSSSGHIKLRKKSDVNNDGVYNGKLYTDARLQFEKDYSFPNAPKYWVWKVIDSGEDYLDVPPITYNENDGTSDEAFEKWKAKYMSTLSEWVSNLTKKDASEDNEAIQKNGKKEVLESVDDIIDSIMSDMNLML